MKVDHPAFRSSVSGKYIDYQAIVSDRRYRDPQFLLERWSAGFIRFKRAVDVIVGLVMLTALIVLFPFIAILLKRDSPGPIFYRQRRIGKHGKAFVITKFRTMVVDAEASGSSYASANDPRITRFGMILRKSRFDELPQCLNVLRGDMSLIGPRPERPENEEMLEKGIPGFSIRTMVKPGLTGWAQVYAPYANTTEQSKRKLEFDIYYIRHAGVFMDLKVLAKTVLLMLRSGGQ